MDNVLLETLLIFGFLVLNGLFSMAEMAMVSARKSRLEQRAEEGHAGAKAALELSADPNRFLSTVQIAITLVGTLTGAIGGAALASPLAALLARVPQLKPYSEGIAVVIVVLVITFFSLVIGELVPKRLALNNAERIAAGTARLMRTVSRLASPLVSLLSFSTDLFLRLIGARPSSEPAVTEEDVQSMISQGTELGVFEAAEQDMVNQVFRLSDRKISTLMTPRSEIEVLDLDDPLEVNLQKVVQTCYSRFPVIQDSLDNVLGVVHVRHLLADMLEGKQPSIEAAMRQPMFVPESMTPFDVLRQMGEDRSELALVIDEFGGLMGLVSLNDILEAVVGDVGNRPEGQEPEVVFREDGSILLDGLLIIDEVKDALNLDYLPDEEKGYYETLSGLMMTALGRVPTSGDSFETAGLRFEVVDMDGRRVDKVLVTRQNGAEPKPE